MTLAMPGKVEKTIPRIEKVALNRRQVLLQLISKVYFLSDTLLQDTGRRQMIVCFKHNSCKIFHDISRGFSKKNHEVFEYQYSSFARGLLLKFQAMINSRDIRGR